MTYTAWKACAPATSLGRSLGPQQRCVGAGCLGVSSRAKAPSCPTSATPTRWARGASLQIRAEYERLKEINELAAQQRSAASKVRARRSVGARGRRRPRSCERRPGIRRPVPRRNPRLAQGDCTVRLDASNLVNPYFGGGSLPRSGTAATPWVLQTAPDPCQAHGALGSVAP